MESIPTWRPQRQNLFDGLVDRGLLPEERLRFILAQDGAPPELTLMQAGIPKHEILRCLTEFYRLPFVEFSENQLPPDDLTAGLDLERLKQRLWFPLSVAGAGADVLLCNPMDGTLDEEIKQTLGVADLKKHCILASDLVRLIQHLQDANPGYPASAGRTRLAQTRNALTRLRTNLAFHRTSLAKGRTGLAMMRTGLSFNAIALAMLQVFGFGYAAIPDSLLLLGGLALAVEGLRWYLPTRKTAREAPAYKPSEPTFGSTFLEMSGQGEKLAFTRKGPVEGAEALRTGWNRLSPVMKRRFLAIDRTDHAEERTILASYRTSMARARTGLAFMRTGIALIGVGMALLRQFPLSQWAVFNMIFILLGSAMALEGFHWYIPGRRAGNEGLRLIRKAHQNQSIWDFMFTLFRDQLSAGELPAALFIKDSHSPGIWGTTGLALERSLIAERRNVKARFRTTLARSRTGMAFIRTGTKIFSVGLGLLVYFGSGNTLWLICYAAMMAAGLICIADGFYWHVPAERIKALFPYCSADMEILFPDYSKPTSSWKKVVFSHHEL